MTADLPTFLFLIFVCPMVNNNNSGAPGKLDQYIQLSFIYRSFTDCSDTESALIHAMTLFCAHALHLVAAKAAARVVRIGPEGLPTTLDSAALGSSENSSQHIMLWAVLQTIGLALTFPLVIGVGVLLAWHVYICLSVRVPALLYLLFRKRIG